MGRPRKYATEEERKAAAKAQRLAHYHQNKHKNNPARAEKQRAAYHQQKNDPVRAEKLRAKNRAAYAKRKSTPEGKALHAAQAAAAQKRYRVLAVRLKRIAKARGVTPEALLDEMERADG